MNVSSMEVLHAQVAQIDTSSAQLLQVEASIDLLTEQATTIRWYNVVKGGMRSEKWFASATVRYEDSAAWQTEWGRVTHLLESRIEALTRMASEGTANKLSKNMAYTLFKNVVDYTDKYRGMQSVVLHEHEACADITLVPERHGTWHTPPHWIDSIFHLAGFIMNGSDASNTKDFFYVTPGWNSYRMARPFKPSASYRSYVRMFPVPEGANMYAGDVYVFQDNVVVGMMGQIKFRRVPRLLMNQFFSPPDVTKTSSPTAKIAPKPVAPTPTPAVPVSRQTSAPVVQKQPTEAPAASVSDEKKIPGPEPEATKPAAATEGNSVIDDCMRLIACETGLDLEVLTDDTSFVELGVDSLMSLVLSEKFRSDLQLEVKSSLFIECPSIGDLKGWLEKYC